MREKRSSFVANSFSLLKQTFRNGSRTRRPTGSCPRLLHCVFARPAVLLLLAIVGFFFHNDPAGLGEK